MITVAIIEDHKILIDALELMLQNNQEFRFVGAALSLADGYQLIQTTQPDILLLDIHLPDGNGYNLVPKILGSSPKTHVVVLTSYTDEDTIMRAVDLGVSGFLPKSASLSEFYHTIRKAAEGEIVMPPHLLIGLLRRVPRDRAVMSHADGMWERLTPREYEILSHLAAGKSGNMIAEELNIAPLTVRTHVRNLMSKLGVHSRLEAVAYGVKHGLIDAFG
jgi:NarL family two-component system response regulator LiaR